MKTDIALAPGLDIPINAITESFAILGRRGSGKTVTANRLIEGMLDCGQQVIAFDPTNAWWGLRSSADGTSPGYAIPLFGGQRSDVPITDAVGMDLADALLETRMSAVVCVRDFSKAGTLRFAGAFFERLYDRKCEAKFRDPLHISIDESDVVVPQRIQRGGERAYGAVDTMVRRGRIDGFGVSLISQRPAVIAKDVLTQTEVMIAHQTTGPQDQKAILDWVKEHATDDQRKAFMATLATLKKGEAWFWSPAWLEVFKRIQVNMRRTWNSSQTPKVGEKLPEPKVMALVDVDAVRRHLATKSTASKARHAKDDTPTGGVELQLSSASDTSWKDKKIEELQSLKYTLILENEFLRKANVTLHAAIEAARAALTPSDDVATKQHWDFKAIPGNPYEKLIEDCNTETSKLVLGASLATPQPDDKETATEPSNVAAKTWEVVHVHPKHKLDSVQERLLTALAQVGPMSLTQTAITAGLAPNQGRIYAAAKELREEKYVTGGNDLLTPTAKGTSAVSGVALLPTGKKLVEFWLDKLDGCEGGILKQVVAVYPKSLSLTDAATRCGIQPNQGRVYGAAKKLRLLGLVTGKNAAMTANERLVR